MCTAFPPALITGKIAEYSFLFSGEMIMIFIILIIWNDHIQVCSMYISCFDNGTTDNSRSHFCVGFVLFHSCDHVISCDCNFQWLFHKQVIFSGKKQLGNLKLGLRIRKEERKKKPRLIKKDLLTRDWRPYQVLKWIKAAHQHFNMRTILVNKIPNFRCDKPRSQTQLQWSPWRYFTHWEVFHLVLCHFKIFPDLFNTIEAIS